MAIAERLNVAHSMIHRLWKHAEHMHTTGIINSPELLSWKKIPGECLSICQTSLRRVSSVYCVPSESWQSQWGCPKQQLIQFPPEMVEN